MDDLSCKQRCANVVAMEMLKNCKSAQTKAQYYGIQKTTSERSEWFHKNKFDIMMAWMTPVSLHFSDVPTGWKKIFTDKQQLATGFACSSRTVSPDEQCYRLICASCTQFHVPFGTQAFPPTSICSFISKLKTRLLSLTSQTKASNAIFPQFLTSKVHFVQKGYD